MQKNILVVGDIMLDHYVYGTCERISPEAPVPVVDFKSDKWLLGGAANVANNLIELGCDVSLCGLVGNDDNRIKFENLLTERGIANMVFASGNRKTTVKSRVISNGHQLLRIDDENRNDIKIEDENHIYEMISRHIKNFRLILLSDYSKGLLTIGLTKKIIELANRHNILTIVDPKNPPYTKFFGSTILKPNKREAFLQTGIDICDNHSLLKACEELQKTTKCQAVIITLSEGGVGVFLNNKLSIIPTKAKEVFDVTGAGDTFLAGLAFSLINSYDILKACEFANFASAVVVGKQGCATAQLDEINYLIEIDENE